MTDAELDALYDEMNAMPRPTNRAELVKMYPRWKRVTDAIAAELDRRFL